LDVPGAGDPQPLQIRLPLRLLRKRLLVCEELALRFGQLLPHHILPGCLIEHVVGLPGPQQVQKIAPTLALRTRKPRQELITNVGAIPILPAVPRRRLIHPHLPRHG